MANVGVIGLGTVGKAVAGHLLEDDHSVCVYDIDPAAMERMEGKGANIKANVAALAQSTEVVLLTLPGPDAVTEVVFCKEGLASAMEGGILVDLSTTGIDVTRRIAQWATNSTVEFISAPVSGGPLGAKEGTLCVMAGGDANVIDDCRPIFDSFANSVISVGSSGELAQCAKLVNQHLTLTAVVATCEAMALGERAGLSVETMTAILNESSGANVATEFHFPEHIITDRFSTGTTFELIMKDANLLDEWADETGGPMLVGQVVRQLLQFAQSQYGSDSDWTNTYNFYREIHQS